MMIRVSSHGRIVIPVSLRRKLGVKAGTHINIQIDSVSGHIFLTPITRQYIHNLRGKYRGKGLLKALIEERKRMREKSE